MLLASGCSDEYDDSVLTGRVDNLESRVEKLEELCKQMNTNISSLQTLVTALQDNDYITAVTPVTNGGKTIGYTITFKKASPITIYHGTDGKDGQDGTGGTNGTNGKDGATPKIGVAKFEGVYYWTLNGEWLTDASGNKIKAEGTDGKPGQEGKDGITPKLKIEDGYWWISYDNEQNWIQVGQATGDKGDKGDPGTPGTSGGDSIFSKVEDNATEVIFTLADGTTTITIPKATSPEPLGITFSLTESVNVLPGKSYEIGYTLSGADEQTVIDVVAQNGYRADVVKTDYQSGKIVITAPETAADDRIIVLVSDGNDRTLMRFINVAESIIRITTDSYTIESDGGTQAVEVETNIDYTVHITEADREWVSLAPETRAAVHTETLNFTFHANPNTTYRYATVELRDASGMVGQSILFAQKAAGYKTVHVATAGTLETYISAAEKESLVGLKITGTLNASDYQFIRDMPALRSLDISQTTLTTTSSMFFSKSPNIEQVILPLNLEVIHDYTFNNSNITSIEIPASVTVIGASAFSACRELSGNLILPEGLQSIGNSAFSSCKLSGSLTIPNSVTILGNKAFQTCFGFKGTLTLGTGITTIPDYCFYSCTGFTGNLVIPDQVTSIGENAFTSCRGFEGHLIIGSGVQEIGDEAFIYKTFVSGPEGAEGLFVDYAPLSFAKIYCKAATPPKLSLKVFAIKDKFICNYLGVPVGCKAAYLAQPEWKDSFAIIEEVEF